MCTLPGNSAVADNHCVQVVEVCPNIVAYMNLFIISLYVVIFAKADRKGRNM